MSENSADSSVTPHNTPSFLSDDVLQSVMVGLGDESAKRREATINRYGAMPENDERVNAVLQQIAANDLTPYVREAANKTLSQKRMSGAKTVVSTGSDVVAMTVPAASTAPIELSVEARHAILQKEIQRYIKDGYRIGMQTDTTAQLIKPKRVSCAAVLILLVLSLLLIGLILLLVYFLWYATQKDDQVYLEVDTLGKVKTTKRKG